MKLRLLSLIVALWSVAHVYGAQAPKYIFFKYMTKI